MSDLIRALPKHILGFNGDYQALYDIEKNKISDRRYRLPGKVILNVQTDKGTLHSVYEKGFEFDGRSGPKIVDWYVPNLGSIYERIAWLNHDGGGYATCLDFKSINRLLSTWLHDEAGYSKFKSKLVETAVSLDDSWFGIPEEGDTWYCNLGKFELTWESKK